MLQRALPALMLVALSLASLNADAQWTWRDKTGRVTASDRPPPPDVADKDILSRPAAARRATLPAPAAASAVTSAASTAAPQKTALDKEVEARKRAADQEQAARTKAEEDKQAAQRADNCKRARSALASLESGQRMARVNDKGEREVLDDAARAEEAKRARDVIASECR